MDERLKRSNDEIAALNIRQRYEYALRKRISELEAELIRVASCISYKWPSEAQRLRNFVENKTDITIIPPNGIVEHVGWNQIETAPMDGTEGSQRGRVTLDDLEFVPQHVSNASLAALTVDTQSVLKRIAELEAELHAIKYELMGGEDAPGSASLATVEDCKKEVARLRRIEFSARGLADSISRYE